MRRATKVYLVPEPREPAGAGASATARRRWGRSIRGGRRGVRSRGREFRRGRLAPRPGRRPPADPPKAGEGRQEHARPLARSPPLLPFAPRSSLRAGAAAAALPILLLLLLLLRREQRVLEGIAGKPGTVAAALQGGTCSGIAFARSLACLHARSSRCLRPRPRSRSLRLAAAARLPSLFSGF